jgi:hypothetical protein
MISDTEKLALVRASKDLNMTPLELIEATCQACMATFINSDVAKVEREACALIADQEYRKFKVTEETHYKYSPKPFNPLQFGLNMDVVNQSKYLSMEIRARGEA